MLSMAARGECSDRTTRAMSIAWTSLIHLLKEMAGILDQEMLISIKTTRTISQGLDFKTLAQSIFLRLSTHNAAQMRIVRKVRSKGLPASGSRLVLLNQVARGLLER